MDVKVKKNVGPQGYATVRRLKNNIRVVFATGDVYEIEDQTQLPKGFEDGEYNLSLSADATKIFGIRPTAGSYVMRFVEIPKDKNGVLDVKTQRGRMVVTENQKYMIPDQLVFPNIIKVIADGHRFDGLTLYHQLPYLFTNVPGTGDTMLSGSKGQIARLENFLRVCGLDVAAVTIPFGPPPAILGWLDAYLQEHAVPFFGTVDEKGWIKEVAVLPPNLANLKPARKSAKRK